MIKKHICVQCGYQGKLQDFSPSIEIGPGDFRIFHPYGSLNGPILCKKCKIKHLIKIGKKKNLTDENIEYLKKQLEEK